MNKHLQIRNEGSLGVSGSKDWSDQRWGYTKSDFLERKKG